jgi:hypothetical protein
MILQIVLSRTRSFYLRTPAEIQPYPDWWISGYVGYAILQPATLIENALAGNLNLVVGDAAVDLRWRAEKWNWSFNLFNRNLETIRQPVVIRFSGDH